MDKHMSDPLAFQDSFNRDEFLEGGNSSADDGKDESCTGNTFFENEMSFNSDKFLYVNFSDDLLSSNPIFSNLSQITEDMCLSQQQQQLQQHTEQQVHYPSPLTDSSAFAFPLGYTFAQQQQSQGHDAHVLTMSQLSTLQHVPESQQAHQDIATLDSQQQLLQHQTTTLPSQSRQYCDSSVLNAFQQHLPSPSPSLDASTAASVAIIATATATTTHHQQNPNYYNNILLKQTPSAQQISMDFAQFRSPALSHFSIASPDEGSLSPVSDHGYFNITGECSSSSSFYHPLSSAYLSNSGAEYLTGSLQDFALSAGNGLFPLLTSASSASSASTSVAAAPFNTILTSPTFSITDLRTVLAPPTAVGRAACKTASQQQQQATPGHRQDHQGSFLSSPASSTSSTLGSYSPTLSTSSTTPLFGSTVPALSSPLKQQVKRVAFSDEDDSDIPNEEEESKRNPKRRKRVRKAAPKPVNKPKGPRITLYCQYPGCKVTCSSHPSMIRHSEAHKWRGRYSPVRCEACQSSLSNEFSVQRHILRSAESSRCRKMRTYSIMRSETEIDNTVKFCPTRPHGKKTVPVNLAKMKAKYIEGWKGTMEVLVGQCEEVHKNTTKPT
ncbi:MAG: hypothetical protein JOS17DRAFT_780648 [Linnemannia elongata]|nr:MAG: hypothetical protein JOS17DRAFT_780648 [Linnemannia elongata]